MEYKYYPNEIAETLCMLAGAENSNDEGVRNDCEKALYYLEAEAELEGVYTILEMIGIATEMNKNGYIECSFI